MIYNSRLNHYKNKLLSSGFTSSTLCIDGSFPSFSWNTYWRTSITAGNCSATISFSISDSCSTSCHSLGSPRKPTGNKTEKKNLQEQLDLLKYAEHSRSWWAFRFQHLHSRTIHSCTSSLSKYLLNRDKTTLFSSVNRLFCRNLLITMSSLSNWIIVWNTCVHLNIIQWTKSHRFTCFLVGIHLR